MKLSSLLVSISSSLVVLVGLPALAPVTVTSTSAICVPKHGDDDSCLTADEWSSAVEEQSLFLKEMEAYRRETSRICYGIIDSTIYPMLASEHGQVNETTLRLEYEPSGSYFLDQEVQNRCTLQ